jgi:SPP1 gp7 family putative phage head morphogenesis protein
MPVHKVRGGYKWGKHGKVYKTRAGAERQARAIYANGWRGDSVSHGTVLRAHSRSRIGESGYVNALRGIVRSLHEHVVGIVRPGLSFLAGRREDTTRWGATLEQRLGGLIKQIEGHTGPAFDKMANEAVPSAVATTTELLGFRPSLAGVDVNVETARRENIALMVKAGEDYAEDIMAVIDNPNTWDFTLEELYALVQQAGDKSMARVALIARDQVYKLNAATSRAMQESAGCNRYWWSTCLDERVRKTHQANEKQVFYWSNPSPITGHPGHDPNCRCLAIPLVPSSANDGHSPGTSQGPATNPMKLLIPPLL